MHFDKFLLLYKESIIPTIQPCYCKDVYEKDGNVLKCSESPCKIGLTFDDAKIALVKSIEKTITEIKGCETYNEYKLTAE